MKNLLIVLVSIGGFYSTAHADQCDFNSTQFSERALYYIQPGSKIVSFCEPCGDKQPSQPEVVTDGPYSLAVDGGQYQEVQINGKGFDLAYTFVKTSDDKYENVASLVGCPTTGVSKSVEVK